MIHNSNNNFGEIRFETGKYFVLDKKPGVLSTEISPYIVHRLDKDTSGLILVAKGGREKKKLQRIFKKRNILKIYTAFAVGKFNDKRGKVEGYMVRDKKNYKKRRFVRARERGVKEKHKKYALTKYWLIGEFKKDIFKRPDQSEFNHFSLLKVKIQTGRTHQIRVQMASLHHPVVGDELYGGKKMKEINKFLGLKRQFLHASKLSFFDPWEKKKVQIISNLPDDLNRVLNKLD